MNKNGREKERKRKKNEMGREVKEKGKGKSLAPNLRRLATLLRVI